MSKFPHCRQPDHKDCGPTCLKIVAKHYGKVVSLPEIRQLSETTRRGSSLLTLCDAAKKLGFRATGVRVTYPTLRDEVPLPCVLHWNNHHYVVAYKLKKDKVYLSDPARGRVMVNKATFL